MRKLRRLALTAAALAALAVGGAAFAQAQNAGNPAEVTVQQPMGETSAPGDTDGVQSRDQGGLDGGSQADERGSEEGSRAEAPDSSTESDGPGSHHDERGGAGTVHESEGSD